MPMMTTVSRNLPKHRGIQQVQIRICRNHAIGKNYLIPLADISSPKTAAEISLQDLIRQVKQDLEKVTRPNIPGWYRLIWLLFFPKWAGIVTLSNGSTIFSPS